jgi:hypothetical protein
MHRGKRHLFKHIVALLSTINDFPDRTDNFRFLTIFSATRVFGQSVKESLRFQPINGALALEANPTNPPFLLLRPLLCKIVMYYVGEVTPEKTTWTEMDDTSLKRPPVVRRRRLLPPQTRYSTEVRTGNTGGL